MTFIVTTPVHPHTERQDEAKATMEREVCLFKLGSETSVALASLAKYVALYLAPGACRQALALSDLRSEHH
jgi:hypothetical protein